MSKQYLFKGTHGSIPVESTVNLVSTNEKTGYSAVKTEDGVVCGVKTTELMPLEEQNSGKMSLGSIDLSLTLPQGINIFSGTIEDSEGRLWKVCASMTDD